MRVDWIRNADVVASRPVTRARLRTVLVAFLRDSGLSYSRACADFRRVLRALDATGRAELLLGSHGRLIVSAD